MEKNFSEESLFPSTASSPATRPDSLVEQLFLESGTLGTFLNTADMRNLAAKTPQAALLESLSSLQQFRSRFSTIIMPEGLKNFLHEDVRALEIGHQVEEIISSGGPALEDVKQEARFHTRCIMLNMESPHLPPVEIAGSMRHRYQQFMGLLRV